MKKLGVIASFLFALAATTVAGPKPALAQQPPNNDPTFVCVNDPNLANICVEILAFGYALEGNTKTVLQRDGSTRLSSSGGGISNITITKNFDTEFSPWLIMSAINGQGWQEVAIEVVTPGCVPESGCAAFRLQMSNVFVQSCETTVTNALGLSTEDLLTFVTEVCTFASDSVEIFFPQ